MKVKIETSTLPTIVNGFLSFSYNLKKKFFCLTICSTCDVVMLKEKEISEM
jgi:hypothetical protein